MGVLSPKGRCVKVCVSLGMETAEEKFEELLREQLRECKHSPGHHHLNGLRCTGYYYYNYFRKRNEYRHPNDLIDDQFCRSTTLI